ncbi:TspO/MBR family protein [Oscillibacter sp.]|uniref:TspO/MBR family protein n=1 Tax=Oscillibacter sp. TaxID=1945593 RepID=UPI0028992C54|nr:TspO/MBR family protein [Oscillibacter sp.]
MEKKPWKSYAFFILFNLVVSGLVSWATSGAMESYEAVKKSSLTPPSFIFPIVWTVLYTLMGISAAIIYQSESPYKKRALTIYFIQLVVNFLWSFLFFNLQMYGLSFFWLLFLLALIILMIITFWQVNRTAALLQIPYLIWVYFDGYLAYSIWQLN